MKIRFWMLLVPLALFAGGCKDSNENNVQEQEVFKVNPKFFPGETAIGHDIEVNVTSNREISASLVNGSWASVKSITNEKGQEYEITVALNFNSTDKERRDTLVISNGIKESSVMIAQKSLTALINKGTEVHLDGLIAATYSISLPEDWTLSIESQTQEWLEANPQSGNKNVSVDVSFRAKSLNLDAAQRIGTATVMFEGGEFNLTVYQHSSLPSADFIARGDYGLYNYDGKGSNVVYDELIHQTSELRDTVNKFRIIYPKKNKMLEFSHLASTCAEGKDVTFILNQYWVESLGTQYQITATVAKVEGGKVWLIDTYNHGYIIKLPSE